MEAYKKVGNRENAPPKHEMVHFPGLMSEKRSFGDFRTVLHTGLYSECLSSLFVSLYVFGEIGCDVATTALQGYLANHYLQARSSPWKYP